MGSPNEGRMRPFSLLIKPAGADCNLRCAYCFYLSRRALYPEATLPRMGVDTLTRLVRSYLALPFPAHAFAFQGGEPLLMGEAFYRTLLRLQRRYARPGTRITNCVQTNGTLLTPSMAALFAQEKFLLGVSVDGPKAIHDKRRPDAAGHGSHAAVMRGLGLLKSAGAEFNVLTLVSQSNVNNPLETYRYLRDDLGARYLQFIECVEFDAQGHPLPYAVTPEAWADFLIAIFDEWYAHDLRTVSVRLFDSVVSKLLTGNANSCSMGCDCRDYFVVEHNGDVYPCDFFVCPELRLGNLATHDWDALWDDPRHTAFGARKAMMNPACEVCPHRLFCQGDCPKNRTGHNPTHDPRALSFLCPAWKRIYAHIVPPLRREAERLRRQGQKRKRA